MSELYPQDTAFACSLHICDWLGVYGPPTPDALSIAEDCYRLLVQYVGEQRAEELVVAMLIRDFQTLVSEDDAKLMFVELALCEGCGPIQVNRDGECKSPDCDKKHG